MDAVKKTPSKSFLTNLENSVSPVILNRWLWIVLILLAILFVVLELLRYTKPRLDLTSSAQNRTSGAVVPPGVVPFSNFEPALRQRDLFSLNVQTSEGTAAAPTALDDEVQNYLVIGIVGSSGREEAIVQDRRSRQTYFLTAGSQVGSLEVAEIRKQSIVLRRGNESRELFLP